MEDKAFNEQKEFRRLKELIHTAPISDTRLLKEEMQRFGELCHDKSLYRSLKWKYKWHRELSSRHYPLGKPDEAWSRRETPLVSVIVPNYNHARYLTERIESILNQSFQNFELILLDDCSTDESRDVLSRYQDHPKVSHILVNEQNTGNTFLQWEKGVSLAKGRYIWIAESDDYADESFLDTVMAAFALHEDCAVVRTGSYQVNERGRVLLRDWDVWKEDENLRYYDGVKYINHNMLHFNYLYNASMLVFRKDAFSRIDKSYQQLRYVGDWQCWIEMLLEGPVCEYHRKLNYFRQHDNKVSSRSRQTGRVVIEQLQVMDYVFQHARISLLRRLIIRGKCYELVKKAIFDVGQEKASDILLHHIKATTTDYCLYKLLKAISFLPFIPFDRNDKLK
jgi:hypothetical protein